MHVRRCDTRSYRAASVPSWDAPDALFRIREGGEHHLAQRLEGGLKVVANDLQQVTQQQHAQLAVHSRRRGLHALCDEREQLRPLVRRHQLLGQGRSEAANSNTDDKARAPW